jgi:carbon-monoxide dehydrogenase large subunit
MPKDGGIGAATLRREDVRFLTGDGQYSDDINLFGQAAAVFARSTVANGVIKSIDTSAAEAMPGVLAIFTGEDFAEVGGNPAGWLINSRDGEPMKEPKRPVLAHGKVRHVGDAYAAVIAETIEQAKNAVEAIEADI